GEAGVASSQRIEPELGHERSYDGHATPKRSGGVNRMHYLDYAATAPILPEVREAMLPYLDDRWGNPSSIYATGREARKGIDEAREKFAFAVGASPEEVVFTGGGTEADNLDVKCAAW